MKAHLQQDKPTHWRSLEEREMTPETRAAGWQEFAPGASEPMELPSEGLSRRRFLGLVGATAALAATAACSKVDRGTIVPYTKRPIEVVPGVANYYASTFQEGRRAYSVLVKTREGRPIHITGNDEDPRFKGKTSPRAMADILRLYDPDRLQGAQDRRQASHLGRGIHEDDPRPRGREIGRQAGPPPYGRRAFSLPPRRHRGPQGEPSDASSMWPGSRESPRVRSRPHSRRSARRYPS